MSRSCAISGPDKAVEVGASGPLAIIAGPCLIESRDLCMRIGEALVRSSRDLGLPVIFKASFDKANRTSIGSARGPGIDEGLAVLEHLRNELGVPVTTDIHAPEQAAAAAPVVDLLQIPAFLCRQTDLLLAAGEHAGSNDAAINIKKGQFLSPKEMAGPVEKVASAGCRRIMVTERGTFFGYHRLVNDLIGLGDLMELNVAGGPRPPVCFDATHSAQLPGATSTTGGRRDRVPMLACAAVASGVDAIFLETHPDPASAQSDASTMLALDDLPPLLERLKRISLSIR